MTDWQDFGYKVITGLALAAIAGLLGSIPAKQPLGADAGAILGLCLVNLMIIGEDYVLANRYPSGGKGVRGAFLDIATILYFFALAGLCVATILIWKGSAPFAVYLGCLLGVNVIDGLWCLLFLKTGHEKAKREAVFYEFLLARDIPGALIVVMLFFALPRPAALAVSVSAIFGAFVLEIVLSRVVGSVVTSFRTGV